MTRFYFVITMMTLVTVPRVNFAKDAGDRPQVDPSEIERLLERSEHESALQACLDGIKGQPNEPAYHRLRAQALRSLDRIAEIPTAISPAIERFPRNSGLILQRAIAHKNLGDLANVNRDAESMVRLGDGLGFVLLAQLAEANGERLTAIRCYTRLMETFPGSEDLANWQFARAKQFVVLNVLDWAFADATASNQADPSPLKVLLLGEISARAEKWDAAESRLAKFNTMTDEHYVGEVRRLNVLMDMSEHEKVALLLEQYDQKYKDTDKLSHVADVRAWVDGQNTLQNFIRQAARMQGRPHGWRQVKKSQPAKNG